MLRTCARSGIVRAGCAPEFCILGTSFPTIVAVIFPIALGLSSFFAVAGSVVRQLFGLRIEDGRSRVNRMVHRKWNTASPEQVRRLELA
jgi:hypothetical protein